MAADYERRQAGIAALHTAPCGWAASDCGFQVTTSARFERCRKVLHAAIHGGGGGGGRKTNRMLESAWPPAGEHGSQVDVCSLLAAGGRDDLLLQLPGHRQHHHHDALHDGGREYVSYDPLVSDTAMIRAANLQRFQVR